MFDWWCTMDDVWWCMMMYYDGVLNFLRSLKSRSCREIIPETGARRLGTKPGHVWWPFEDFPRKTNDFPIYRYNIFVNDFPTDKNDDFPVGFPYRWFPVGFSHSQWENQMISHDFPMIFLWFSHVFHGFSYGLPKDALTEHPPVGSSKAVPIDEVDFEMLEEAAQVPRPG